MAIVAGLAAIAIHIGVAAFSPKRTVVDIENQSLTLKPAATAPAATGSWGEASGTPGAVSFGGTPIATAAQSLTTEPFDLTSDTSLTLDIWTNLDNRWADFDLTLVNDTTHQDFDIHGGTSHYYGVDDGESWSEGSNHARAYTPLLPKGRYRLMIDADSDAFSTYSQVPFSLELRTGMTDIWNLWAALLLLAIYPAWVAWRVWSFESARWSNSDYSPGGQLLANQEA